MIELKQDQPGPIPTHLEDMMSTLSQRMTTLEAALEILLARSAPTTTAPAAAKVTKYRTGKRDKDGNVPNGFPCTLGCGRKLRTAARATSHDIATGHVAKS
jgi:hypothetical protein